MPAPDRPARPLMRLLIRGSRWPVSASHDTGRGGGGSHSPAITQGRGAGHGLRVKPSALHASLPTPW
jgi:hypothetical protein